MRFGKRGIDDDDVHRRWIHGIVERRRGEFNNRVILFNMFSLQLCRVDGARYGGQKEFIINGIHRGVGHGIVVVIDWIQWCRDVRRRWFCAR